MIRTSAPAQEPRSARSARGTPRNVTSGPYIPPSRGPMLPPPSPRALLAPAPSPRALLALAPSPRALLVPAPPPRPIRPPPPVHDHRQGQYAVAWAGSRG